MKRSIFIMLAIGVILILAACGNGNESETDEGAQGEEDAFTIGVIPAQSEGSMDNAMDKIQTILSEALDREVSVDVYPDYNGVVEALNYGQINMAYLGPLTFVVANENSGAQAIITQLIDGEPFYYSYIITHSDSPWESLDELLENPGEIDFAFGDISSTSGTLIPSMELEDRGVYESDSEHEFNAVRFTGSHDATALAVQNNQVDAGAIDSVIFNQLAESGGIDEEQYRIIWESAELFQYPWAVHSDTDQETIETLQEAFIGIEDEEILDAFGATGFTEATNEDYESIREAVIRQGILEE